MKKFIVPLAAALAIAGCGFSGTGMPPSSGAFAGPYVPQWQAAILRARPVRTVRPGEGQCAALIGYARFRPDVIGWKPADIQAAYDLPSSSKGKGQVVALIDAYDNPNVASDLAAYRSYFCIAESKVFQIQSKGRAEALPQG